MLAEANYSKGTVFWQIGDVCWDYHTVSMRLFGFSALAQVIYQKIHEKSLFPKLAMLVQGECQLFKGQSS
jgi:hypothetical protein